MNTLNGHAENTDLQYRKTVQASLKVSRWLWATPAILLFALLPAATQACGLSVGPGSTVTVLGTLTVNCVDIADTGKIVVTSNGTLILTGADGKNTSTVDGRIVLESCNSVLQITDDHTFTGDGRIIGECNTATIIGGQGCVLTVDEGFTIQGALRTCVDLVNNGTVKADDATSTATRDRLTIDWGKITGSGSFEVTAANAYLEFDATGVDATRLYTYFALSDGTLECQTDVTSTRPGCFSMDSGTTVIVCGNATATFY